MLGVIICSPFLIYEFIGGFLGAIFDVSVSAFLFYTPAYPARARQLALSIILSSSTLSGTKWRSFESQFTTTRLRRVRDVL